MLKVNVNNKKKFNKKISFKNSFLNFFSNQVSNSSSWWLKKPANIEVKKSKVYCIVKVTPNNFFSTGLLVNNNKILNKVLFTISGGFVGNKGPRRSTPTCAEEVGHVIAYKFLEKRIGKVFLLVRGKIDRFVRAFSKGARKSGLKFSGVRLEWKVAHNGCRLPIKRRV